MPKVISEVHEHILKAYINNKKTKYEKKVINTWIKYKNDTISPVNITTFPYVSQEKGLSQIAIFDIPERMEIQDNMVTTNSVFIILTSGADKILHMSLNCLTYLKLSPSLMRDDHLISELFPDIVKHTYESLEKGC